MLAIQELNIKQELKNPGERKDKIRAAIIKEYNALIEEMGAIEMLGPSSLTEDEKKSAMGCRMALVQKRPSVDEIAQGKEGRFKARLVAQDLKIKGRLSPGEVHAGVPELSVLRLLVASFDSTKHRLSSTDYDTAYLQAEKSPIPHIIKFVDHLSGKWVYANLYSALYGKQDSAFRWKATLKEGLSEMGFCELCNVAINYRKNPGARTKQKHIDLRQSWLRENSAENLMDSTHNDIVIDTKKNGADIFTKLPTPAMYLYWHNKFMCKAPPSLFRVQQQQ